MRRVILILVFAILLCSAGCMNRNCRYNNQIMVNDEQVSLAAIHNQQDIRGSVGGVVFVVGIIGGSISTEDVYSYYYYLPDGGLMRGKIPATNTVIYEENRTDGVLITHFYNKCVCTECFQAYPWEFPTRYEFHIPKGSIVREFKLT